MKKKQVPAFRYTWRFSVSLTPGEVGTSGSPGSVEKQEQAVASAASRGKGGGGRGVSRGKGRGGCVALTGREEATDARRTTDWGRSWTFGEERGGGGRARRQREEGVNFDLGNGLHTGDLWEGVGIPNEIRVAAAELQIVKSSTDTDLGGDTGNSCG
jgi:hypothetical protein